MTPEKPQKSPSHDLFRNRLDNMLNHRHELYRLADLIDWSMFDTEFGSLYCPDNGCPAKATRLMVGLQYLKHVYGMSDEAVVRRWGIHTTHIAYHRRGAMPAGRSTRSTQRSYVCVRAG